MNKNEGTAKHMAAYVPTFRVAVRKKWGWCGVQNAIFADRLSAVRMAIRLRKKNPKASVRVESYPALPRFVVADSATMGKTVALLVRNIGR